VTRTAFIARLRDGLRGVPPQAANDIVADYEAHFDDAAADGRDEAEVARALGDPGRLARELRAEIQFKNYEAQPSATGAAAAIFAVLGLGALDILILLPILLVVLSILFGFFVAAIALFFAGGIAFAAGPFSDAPGAAILAGIGIMSGSAAALAILTLISIGIVNALVWYGRLHFKILKPAMEPAPAHPGGVVL
jgi:uncharacterized membrane protein